MRQPPNWFVRSLSALDGLLSVRWGQQLDQWVIERKAYIPQTEIGFLSRRFARTMEFSRQMKREKKERESLFHTALQVKEELDSSLQGRRVILFARKLNQDIFNNLCLSDITRYGGYSRLADDLEAAEKREETERQRVDDNENITRHKETYDILRFLRERRSTQLENGVNDLKKLLN